MPDKTTRKIKVNHVNLKTPGVLSEHSTKKDISRFIISPDSMFNYKSKTKKKLVYEIIEPGSKTGGVTPNYPTTPNSPTCPASPERLTRPTSPTIISTSSRKPRRQIAGSIQKQAHLMTEVKEYKKGDMMKTSFSSSKRALLTMGDSFRFSPKEMDQN